MKVTCLLIISLFIFCARMEKVTEVIDGDTFKTEKGNTIRLLGINTPEIGEPGGDIAKEFLSLLILNKAVYLKKDITNKDDHDRLLRYIYLDGICVNMEMIRMGFAETRFYTPDTLFKKEFEELEKLAIRNRKGLWSFSVFQIPDTTYLYSKVFKIPEDKTEAISWKDAGKYYGRVKTVEGKIVASHNTGKVCFLNFHKDWKRYFTAVIFASDFDKFSPHPEDYYLNKRVKVTGLIKEYKGKPEMILKSPQQIKIIE